MHRLVLAGLTLALALTVLAISPLSNLLGGGGFSAWLARAADYNIPTPTATPSPTPVIYASHPVANGVGDFICVALPFARLTQQKMLQRGMAHPWHTSVLLAQWGLEQGWRIPGYTGYNWGNVASLPGYPTVGGIAVWGSPSAFAYGYTPVQGVEEFVFVAGNGYYNNVTANWGNGARAQVVALGQSPWDAAHYNNGNGPGSSLLRLLDDFNLYRFDNPNVGC